MEDYKNKYYIRVNENNRIIKTFSSAFENAEKSDIEIGEGDGSQFRVSKERLTEELHDYANVENGLELINEYGLYCLKYENGVISKISDVELQEELNNLPKSPLTKMEMLEEENIILMETTTQLYESNLEQEKQIEKLEQVNVEMMLAIIELYENSL